MTVFRSTDAIRAFLESLDGWLSDPVTVYLLGGSAMTVRGLKDRTEDIDLALGVDDEFEHVLGTLRSQGFEVVDEPTSSFESVGRTVELHHPERGFRVDLFERQVVGKVWITGRMGERATEFWTGERVTTFVLADEDMFLLKAVSGGDPASGRRRDRQDLRTFAQRGLDYDVILQEIEQQRPFNVEATEARQIRDRSHPLVAIELAVSSLTGLPETFTTRLSRLATELEVEYVVLSALDEDVRHVDRIRERARADVRSLPADGAAEVDAAIDRLARKRILERDGDTLHLGDHA